MMKTTALFAVCLLFVATVSHAAQQRMNVLFLVADDLNSWPLGDQHRYSGKVIAPNIQKLAASGVNFTRAYAPSPVCSPSRTAFFSGVSPWRSGHYHNALQVNESEPLHKALSLAGAFKQAGYTTIGYGKITHGWDQKQHWDRKVGHKRDPDPPNAPLTSVGRGEQDWGPIHLPESQMNGTQLANMTIAQLRKQHDRPFFLACGFFNPHMPWYVPQKYFDLFPLDDVKTPALKANDLADVPPLGVALTAGKSKFVRAVMDAGLHAEAVRAYLATTAYVDTQVGRVLDALDNSPYRDNTIVVFLSDHGFHLGEKNHWQKATLWEEATHCLLMFRVPAPGLTPAPGFAPAGTVCKRFVSLQDIYPTLAALCNLKTRDDLDGRSLLPLLKDPKAPWPSTALTGLSDKANPKVGYITVRNELGRYIRYDTGQEELYDDATDPREWTNVVNDPAYSELLARMRAALPDTSKLATPLPAVERRRRAKD